MVFKRGDLMGEIFISYSHDSEEHRELVFKLSSKLAKVGISCILDQYLDNDTPKEGWASWSERSILEADYVLIICTEGYYRRVRGEMKEEEVGRGVKWEFEFILKLIYKDESQISRFIPVFFNMNDKKYIPERLSDHSYYCLDSDFEYNKLYWRITGQPSTEMSKIILIPPKNINSEGPEYNITEVDQTIEDTDTHLKEEISEQPKGVQKDIKKERDDRAFIAVREKLRDKYNFRNEQRLGGGLFSNSYLVYHKIFEEDHVLHIMDFDLCMKILRKSNINDQEAEFKKRAEKFREKAIFFNRFFRQPNIVNLSDIGFVSNKYEDKEYEIPYFIVKYVKGLSLKELIHQKAPLELERVFKISESILSVLVDLHENDFVFRYIDPKQIIIEDD